MTSYWWSAAVITLATFAFAAAAMSMLIGLAGPALARRVERYSPAARAALLFRLRVLPAASAATLALGVALPVFLWFEPLDNSGETFARTLIVAALAGAALLARGAWRAAASWRASGALMQAWRARGRRLPAFDARMPVLAAPMPTFAIDDSFPTVAVVGFSRPALFIAERVLRECTPDEVRAMVLHECAHVTQRDNLKRFLLRACPDLLGRGSALDRAWTNAAEAAADARAAGGDPASALDLAQALIHVARLAPRVNTLQVASAFYLGGSIESRVRALVEPGDTLPDPSRPLAWVMACAAAVAALMVVGAPAIDRVIETAVRVLP